MDHVVEFQHWETKGCRMPLAEWNQCNKKRVIGVIVQVSRSLQFRHAITHHCNIYSNHSACSQIFGHVMQCLFANLTLLHCRPLPCGSSFIAARLNAAVCSLRLERWWLGPRYDVNGSRQQKRRALLVPCTTMQNLIWPLLQEDATRWKWSNPCVK